MLLLENGGSQGRADFLILASSSFGGIRGEGAFYIYIKKGVARLGGTVGPSYHDDLESSCCWTTEILLEPTGLPLHGPTKLLISRRGRSEDHSRQAT